MKKMIFSFLFILSLTALEAQVDYATQIQSIFNNSCTSCHIYGHNSGLNLTTYSATMTGGNTGAAIVAGNHASSLLWVRVDNGSMPPSGTLTSAQVDLIAQWIDEGALETPAVDSENLFFSEYIEASSGNHKAIEIYNPTGSAIDLGEYKVQQSNNGAGWGMDDGPPPVAEPGFTLQLTGTLSSGDVYVLAADAADAYTILSVADIVLSYPSVVHFNGDDAVGLFHNDVLIDVIGVPTEEGAWDVAGVSNGTQDHKLVRKSTVTSGNTDWAVSAGTSENNSEWIVEEANAGDLFNITLGSHIYGTGGDNIDPIASAGSNQTVIVSSSVTLDGSSSTDPDGTIELYSWSQTAGTTVVLSSTSDAEVSFTAPEVVDSLSFTLTVTDNDGATSAETVYVKTVQGVNNTVFFSEYSEGGVGSGYNKYLEIYNGSGQDIDLSNYNVSSCNGGCDDASTWDFPSNITFETGTIVLAGDVYVITHGSADPAILAEGDDTFAYLSNGNDAFGLVDAVTGIVIDIIGDRGPDPGDGWDVAGVESATMDHTLVRKSTVENGNSDWASSAGTDAANSEWIVYDDLIWSNLGSHNMGGPEPPIVVIENISPEFITNATEIVIKASASTSTGSISSVVLKYGTNDQLVNQVDMDYESTESLWIGYIDNHQGNTFLQMRAFATTSESAEGQSTLSERIIASTTQNNISDLYSSQSENEIVTIKGIITIGGGGLLFPTQTKAYIQDQSGRGMQLFDYDLIDGIDRGDEIEAVGYAGYYNTTYQLKDFVFRELSNGNAISDPIVVAPSNVNSSDYEGTLISITGNVTAVTPVSTTGTNLTIDDVTSVMIWNSTGIDISNFVVGYRGQFIGVGSQYNEQYQLLVGYQSDITTVVGVDEEAIIVDKFDLYPAFPNPFNPSTQLSFSVDSPSDIRVEIYDISGKLVDSIISGFFQSGLHIAHWNAKGYSSGMYFVHLIKGHQKLTQKVMLLK